MKNTIILLLIPKEKTRKKPHREVSFREQVPFAHSYLASPKLSAGP